MEDLREGRRIARTENAAGVSTSVRSFTDHTFDILGQRQAETVDIAVLFAEASARMGDKVRVEYLRVHGDITCRVRVSKQSVYGGGDTPSMTLVFDEQLMRERLRSRLLAEGTCLLVDASPAVDAKGDRTNRVGGDAGSGLRVHRVPLRQWAARIPGFVRGEQVIALGMLAWMYNRDPDIIRRLLENRLAARGGRTVSAALRLFEFGWREASQWVPYRYVSSGVGRSPKRPDADVLSGREALVLGALAGNVRRLLPPPSHPLAEGFVRTYKARGGYVALPGQLFELGAASDGSRTVDLSLALDVAGCGADPDWAAAEDGPGPRVTLRIERVVAGEGPVFPSGVNPLTGSVDVLGVPRPLVLAPTTVEQCFSFMNVAGRIAHHYGRHVTVLVDALLLEAVQQRGRFMVGMGGAQRVPMTTRPRPETGRQRAVAEAQSLFTRRLMFEPTVSPMNCRAFAPSELSGNAGTDWGGHDTLDRRLKMSRSVTERGPHVGGTWTDVFSPEVVPWANAEDDPQAETPARAAVASLFAKLGLNSAQPEAFLQPARPVGGDRGALLLLGWGATRGPVEEAVLRLRARGVAVSAVHLFSLSPLPPAFDRLLTRFAHVVAIDVLTDGSEASRGRQLHTMLQGALRAAMTHRTVPGTRAARPRVTMHLFPVPLTATVVERFALQVIS